MRSPRLVATKAPARAEAVVLVLHGGGSRRQDVMVSPTQLSVVRMIPLARRLARAGRGRLAVYRLLNSTRGWDTRHTPVDDAIWALDQLRREHPGLPVGLVGHSLGGRAALVAGAQDDVHSIVALNPYVYPDDVTDLRGRRVLVVHGLADRIASPARSATLAERLMAITDVGYLSVPGGKHAMLRHASVFGRAAADFTVAVLIDQPVSRSQPISQILRGESWVTG